MKRSWSYMEKEIIEEFSKNELEILELLEIMQGEKDPKKWHENIFGNKRCKKSHNFEERPSKSEDGKVVEKHDSLAILHQKDQLSIEVSSSKVCFSSQEHLTSSSKEHLTSDDHDHSYLTFMENFQEHIFQDGKPLEKQLTLSDVNVNLNRLLLNKKHVEKSFLPFLRNGEDIEKGIEVCVYDICKNNYTLTFKKWTNKYYVLNGGWKDFCKAHKLEKNDTIKVWMFRHSNHSNLCFALDYKKIES
ncbi:hypothetical protein LR48_Vigan05g048500 [Vigna angularis]|uniref:TF-B3 domain-containing protein n=1 Tax=Phaseolus angularis TaxID=3914 RepID=A0A0L9UJK9_PHAAN|nr:hypothetical protein LR48_Vigan05g048500 [Vigna angularis]